MGSYGIGISRIPAAIIEKFNDEKGIIWPKEISPFEVILLNLIPKNADVNNLCEKLYQNLKKSNIDIIYDDRSERPGIKFSDADLIGIPIQIIVGKNYVNDEKIGIKIRKTNEEQLVELDELYNILPEKIKNV
jgi:prolyl-tRNA synthetase